MKDKNVIILRKILNYCKQLEEACDMFSNDYNAFVGNLVFQNSNLDYQASWDTIQQDFPELKTEINRILKENEERHEKDH